MLLSQFIVLVLSAMKRFDALVLHAQESVRERLRSRLGFRGEGLAE
jgi:hypothetical protein